jgi:hypothetical protein
MIVLIPSYKRTEILHYVISSVINCDANGIDERILILVVNNYFPNHQVVDSIVLQFDFLDRFECEVIHRKETIPAIESWFSAIFSTAREDEVVCLLGDDDILMPWGLKNRYYQITHSRADMLLSDFYQRLYFFHGGKDCWLDCELPSPPASDIEAISWNYLPAKHPEASFMSNHCYRNTKAFRKGFDAAMTWCHAQDWLPVEFATGNCPLYLAYAIKSTGGKVVSLHEKDVLRGSVFEEAIIQDYADGGNTAFYCLLIYDTFSNQTLHTNLHVFNELREVYKRGFTSSFLSIISNKRISVNMLLKTMRHAGINFRQLLTRTSLLNIYSIIPMILFLRGYRLKKRAKSGALKQTYEFLQIIGSQREIKVTKALSCSNTTNA